MNKCDYMNNEYEEDDDVTINVKEDINRLSLLFNNISINNNNNTYSYSMDDMACTRQKQDVLNIDMNILDIKTLKDKKTKIKTKYVEKKDVHKKVMKERTIEFNNKEYKVDFLFDEIIGEDGEDVLLDIMVFDNKQYCQFMIKAWYNFNYSNQNYTDLLSIVKATESFKNMNKMFLEKLIGEKLIWESILGVIMIKEFNKNILVKKIYKRDINVCLRKTKVAF